jgi:hypothetical protein
LTKSQEKLHADLSILEAMASEMDEYLKNQGMFWPLQDSSMPRLTRGGYLMREARLTQLRHLLSPEEQDRLSAAVRQFDLALVEKVVRFEEKAHEELHARLRQWGEYLKEMRRESVGAGDYYASSVETREMIAALLHKLSSPPYRLDERMLAELQAYDQVLRDHWAPGDFVWAAEWQDAYPKSQHWWLYGRPRSMRGS